MDDPFLQTLSRDGWAVASWKPTGASWGNPASTRDVDLLTAWRADRASCAPGRWVARRR